MAQPMYYDAGYAMEAPFTATQARAEGSAQKSMCSSSVKQQITDNIQFLLAGVHHEGWTYTKDGHVVGKITIVTALVDTAIIGTANQFTTKYHAIVYLRQEQKSFPLAEGTLFNTADQTLQDLLFVTSAGVGKKKFQVLDESDPVVRVGGRLINATLFGER